MYMLSVAQELPPAGHLDGSARAAVEEARAALGELDEMRRMLAAEAAHDCADWAGARARSAALAAWVEVLRSMREAVRARYSAAGGMLADVARIEREIATAQRMVERTLGDAGRAEESLRARLSLAAARELGPAPALPEGVVSIAPDAALAYAIEHRGALAAARSRIDVAEARASAAEARADVPTLMVGAMYMQMPQMRAGLGLEIGMTLPWLWSGERDEAEARRADARAMEAEAAGLELGIAVEVRGALAELETTRRVLRALRESEAPAAALAFDATAATYGAGEGSLLEWLDAARAIRELELEEAEVLTEVAHARVAVASALGASLAELDAPPLRRAE
jgi:outer membrane protein TolC